MVKKFHFQVFSFYFFLKILQTKPNLIQSILNLVKKKISYRKSFINFKLAQKWILGLKFNRTIKNNHSIFV